MEGPPHKRELVEAVGQHRHQGLFAAFLDGTDDCELGALIHGIAMIDPFAPIQVALINRSHAQRPRAAFWLGVPAFAGTGDPRAGLLGIISYGKRLSIE